MKQKLIKLIASCNNEQVRRNWIIEMSNMEDIECSEGECYSCLIANECISTMESIENNTYEDIKEVAVCQI